MFFLRICTLCISILLTSQSVCAADDPSHPQYTYSVKGTLLALPKSGNKELMVKHEPIPDYRDISGKVVGMKAMTMPFYLADDVSTEGLQVGDTIEMQVGQWISPAFKESVLSVKKQG